jgi:alkanesulfonate monooxygenase SsuD/methylene tetrahydromethanopterin reductase-like flavin-dependent oxidoreductase (luciferase family)
VKLGIYLDLRNPEPWRRPWPDHYAQGLARATEADRLGIDAVWLSEHHLFEDGYLPQPLTFAAAVAARTERVRIGTAVLLAALRHPRHVAEEAAVVDLVSGGRLELGIGAGYVVPEFEAFGADHAARYRATDAAVAEVARLLADPDRLPPPVQQPVPLWLGYQGPRGARRAGRLGVGLLSLDPSLLAPYREGLVEGGHDPDGARMGGVVDLIVADDPEAALARILPHLAHHVTTYRRAAAAPGADAGGAGGADERPLPRAITADDLRATGDGAGRVRGLAVLSPDEAVAELRSRTEGLPVEHVYLWASIAGMPDDLVDRHLELLAADVLPALR